MIDEEARDIELDILNYIRNEYKSCLDALKPYDKQEEMFNLSVKCSVNDLLYRVLKHSNYDTNLWDIIFHYMDLFQKTDGDAQRDKMDHKIMEALNEVLIWLIEDATTPEDVAAYEEFRNTLALPYT